MPRKRSPVFHRVSLHLLSLSLLIHKLRKPIIPKLLVLLKKFRKREELKLLRHYSYDYEEYQFEFSASSTPLIRRNQLKNRGHRGLCSFLYLYWCLGNLKVEGTGECHCQVEALPVPVPVSEDGFEAEDSPSTDSEGESVDQKAERFIQTFYHHMRMQRQESL